MKDKNIEIFYEWVRSRISRSLSSKISFLFFMAFIGSLTTPLWKECINYIFKDLMNNHEPFPINWTISFLFLGLGLFFFFFNLYEKKITKNKEIILIRQKSLGEFKETAIENSLSFFEKQKEIKEIKKDHTDFYKNGELESVQNIAESLKDVPIKISAFLETKKDTSIYYYGLSHIPLTFYMGTLLSDFKTPIKLFELDNKSKKWNQLNGNNVIKLKDNLTDISRDEDLKEIFLAIGISYPIDPVHIKDTTVIENPFILNIEALESTRENIKSNDSVEAIRKKFRKTLELIRNNYPNVEKINLYISAPNSVVFSLGNAISERIDPNFQVFNYSKNKPCYKWSLLIKNNNCKYIRHNDYIKKENKNV